MQRVLRALVIGKSVEVLSSFILNHTCYLKDPHSIFEYSILWRLSGAVPVMTNLIVQTIRRKCVF